MKYYLTIANFTTDTRPLDIWESCDSVTNRVKFMKRIHGVLSEGQREQKNQDSVSVFTSPMEFDFIKSYVLETSDDLESLIEKAPIYAL